MVHAISSPISMQLQLQLPLCPRALLPAETSPKRIWPTSVATGNCGIICGGRARQSRSCLFHSHRPTTTAPSTSLSLGTSSPRHLATNQTGILQSAISHSSSTAHQSYLAFATPTGRLPKSYSLDTLQIIHYMVCYRFLRRNQMQFARVAS